MLRFVVPPPLPCSSVNQPAGSGEASRTTRVRKLLTKDR